MNSASTWKYWKKTPSKSIVKEKIRPLKNEKASRKETKLCSRNLKGINTWIVPLVRYSDAFLKWTREELRQTDQKTRKLMSMQKALHPRDDIDRICHEKAKENSPALRITSMHQYEESRDTLKIPKKK